MINWLVKGAFSLFLAVSILLSMSGACQAKTTPSLPRCADTAQVRACADQARAFLKRGDLAHARRAAAKAWEKAELKPLVPADGEPMPEYAYVFPEGEALRFFRWDRNARLSYIEVRRTGVCLLWQVHTVQTGLSINRHKVVSTGRGIDLGPYFAGYFINQEYGKRPALGAVLTRPFTYFELHPTVGAVHYGQIDPAGKVTHRGAASVTSAEVQKNGIVTPIPGERPLALAGRSGNRRVPR